MAKLMVRELIIVASNTWRRRQGENVLPKVFGGVRFPLAAGATVVLMAERPSAESAHPDVLEAAIIGVEDESQLIKPKAYVVLKQGRERCDELENALKQHVKSMLSPYKYPRWVMFVDELPKTATGKIQRFKLREMSHAEST
jgi:benzoate-CoA ligase